MDFNDCSIVDELNIPETLVQITIGEDEIKRRISSFIDLKREEINQNNLRDFIEVEDSCARVSSNVYRVKDSKGHLIIRRIVNETGPATDLKTKQLPSFNGVNERLENIEDLLKTTTTTTPKDVYQRLKILEDQVTLLKTVSPEYSKFIRKDSSKAKKVVYTISDLDSIIASME